MSFNLTQERWIPVVNQNWQRYEVSLVELFEAWETVREIQAENPPTTLAIYRFLLAILHRAYQGPKDIEDWETIQENNGKDVVIYLKQNQRYFDLLHPEQPFMQDLILSQVKEPVPIYVASMMQPAGKATVFSHQHLWNGHALTFAEAACVLIRLQSLDVAGTRAQYPGTTGNRSGSAPPTINSANVILLGENLRETLLRNLIECDPERETPQAFSGEDLPSWELGYGGIPKQKETDANGYVRYLTYPWRRLYLFHNQDRVTDIAITMGNSLRDESKFSWDCGIAYEKGKAIRLSHQKILWRNAHAFLPPPPNSKDFSCPRIVDWAAKLHREGLISEQVVRMQIFGLCVDKENAAEPEFWSCEQLSVPSLYLNNKSLWQSLKSAVDLAEQHQQIFSWRKGSPYHALAEVLKEKKVEKFAESLDGESRYWATLDREFQDLLHKKLPRDVKTDGNGTTYGSTALPAWTETVQKAAGDAFIDSIAPIRNYEARAKALRALEWKLADLRASPEEKEAKKAKAAKKKEKAAK